MWYTMITFQFLFADFFSSVKLKIVFLCNFSGSSSKPLPELKTSFKYSQMYKVSYTLLVLPEKSLPCTPVPCSSLDCVHPQLWSVLSPGLPSIIIWGFLSRLEPSWPTGLLYSWLCPHFVRSQTRFSLLGNCAWKDNSWDLAFSNDLFYPHVLSLDRIWESKWEIIT